MEKEGYGHRGYPRKNVEKKQCIFFLQGRCKFGQQCRYSHEGYSQALMMRHAESEFNKVAGNYPDQQFFQETAKFKLHLNHSFIDCGLSEEGKALCLKTLLPYEYVSKNRELDILFVSPLNRALETADIIIKANKLNVKKVIVLPELTQVLSKICDFCGQISQKKGKYPHFDFIQMKRFLKESSYLEDESNWQDLLVDQDYFHNILAKERNGFRYLMILEQIFPTPLESSQRCFNRALLALDIIKNIAGELKANKDLEVLRCQVFKRKRKEL